MYFYVTCPSIRCTPNNITTYVTHTLGQVWAKILCPSPTSMPSPFPTGRANKTPAWVRHVFHRQLLQPNSNMNFGIKFCIRVLCSSSCGGGETNKFAYSTSEMAKLMHRCFFHASCKKWCSLATTCLQKCKTHDIYAIILSHEMANSLEISADFQSFCESPF
jgi:hypothetical protein